MPNGPKGNKYGPLVSAILVLTFAERKASECKPIAVSLLTLRGWFRSNVRSNPQIAVLSSLGAEHTAQVPNGPKGKKYGPLVSAILILIFAERKASECKPIAVSLLTLSGWFRSNVRPNPQIAVLSSL